MKILLKDNDIKKAHEEYLAFSRDDELREIYEAREKWIRDYNSGMNRTKKTGIAEGMAKGMAKGEAEGKVKEKQKILIRAMNKKYRLSEDERAFITAVQDYDKLDRAYNMAFDKIIEGCLDEETKKEILALLI